MSEIIPRWEWRTFGQRFAGAEAVFAALEASGLQESDELYLLSGDGDNVKVRDDLMDIKILREVAHGGLERWEPVMKAGFPLPAAETTRVLESLRLAVPALDRDAYTLDQFVAELAVPGGTIRPVVVHKRRVRFTIGGCMAELSDIEAAGRTTRTIAVESTDPDAVGAAVRELGLGDHVNTSYPKGLAALIDDQLPRYAVIDAGTNSIKFHVAEKTAEGAWHRLVDRAEITRLGEGLDESGEIGAAALDRALTAIAGMVEEARHHGVQAIAAVGTAGLRIAANRDVVVAAIQEATGVTIEVIDGEEEGRLAFVAAEAGLGRPAGSLTVFDTGGGSSQFTFGHGWQVDERFSVNVGAVRFTERYGLAEAVSPATLDEAMAAIAADLGRLAGRPTPDALVGMGGAMTNIAAVKHGLATYDPDVVQGTVLDAAEIDRQIGLYRSRDAEARRAIVGLQPKRAEVILAGACIIRTIMTKLACETLTVSDRGLRHGLLHERFRASHEEGQP